MSPGCDHCYAFALHDSRYVAWKNGKMPNAAPQYRKPYSQVQLFPERLDLPLRWKKPRKIFVDSMTDLFHEDVPEEFIDQVFATMRRAKRHTFQLLTKRSERMQRYVAGAETRIHKLAPPKPPSHWYHATDWTWPLPNVWLGASAEDQQRADERIPLLLQTPAAVRFISAEPLLGPLNLNAYLYDAIPMQCVNCGEKHIDSDEWASRPHHHHLCLACDNEWGNPEEMYGAETESPSLDWIITGGESGPHRRQMNLDWARSIRDQCNAAGVPFFFKQASALRPGQGTELDVREWHEFPQTCGAVPS